MAKVKPTQGYTITTSTASKMVDVSAEESPEFERFADLTSALVRVPKKDITEPKSKS